MRSLSALLTLVLVAAAAACGSGSIKGDGDAGAADARLLDDGAPSCTNLECLQVACPMGGTTSVSGVVYTPAGNLPLYNVIVYVPNAPVGAVPQGTTCDRCDSLLSGNPLVTTTTDTMGRFTLSDMPVGLDIPVVIQIGKWRRQITLPKVQSCIDTPITDVNLTRLPRNQSEGDIPRMALSTGGADALECLLRKVGIDDAEFTPEAGSGRINLFAGEGGSSKYTAALNGGVDFTASPTFWADVNTLKQYDVVLLSCEGGQNPQTKPPAALQAMYDFTSAGGRMFASHWHNYWLEQGPDPFPTVADWNFQADLADPFTANIDTSFDKGAAFAEWLVNVGGSAVLGEIVIHAGQHTIDAVNQSVAQQWIYGANPTSVQYLTLNTPMTVPPAEQCGRIVLSDIHVSSGDTPGSAFPDGCTTTDLSAQEKALIFMLFDLSSCITPDIG